MDSIRKFFPHAEGYVNIAENGNFEYIYNYTDHLGNVRVSYKYDETAIQTNNIAIVDANNYYPFGLKHKGYASPNENPEYKYKYNGKELQDELGLNFYDYGARNYDSVLGRWMKIDPLEKKYPESSAYVFSINSPILFKDTDGRDWILYTGSKIIYYDGDPGDKTTVLKVYRATSGHKGFQNSAHQYVKDDGPIPAGKFVIELQPDPTRRNKFNSDGTTSPGLGI